MNKLQGKNIGLIIGGGIAAYKSLDLIRRLKERGANVHVILTEAAQKFITPLSASALSHNDVYTSLFTPQGNDVTHIKLASQLDLLIVAPATANRLAEMSIGIANDFAGVTILAATCPILCAPAMNPNMYNHPATQKAISVLKGYGYHFIGPNTGEMAEKNSFGKGRLSEPLEIVARAEELLNPVAKQLKGKKVLITAGATIEPIDPVRYITNYSSGKQAFAIAKEIISAGAEVILIYGNTNIAPPDGAKLIKINTAEEMLNEVQNNLPCDFAIFAAAVCDWRIKKLSPHKLKKTNQTNELELKFVKNPDIIATIGNGQQRPKMVIGFAAETEKHIEYGQKKLWAKKADIILVNNVSKNGNIECAFGSDNNQITLLDKNGTTQIWEKTSKQQIAKYLVDYIVKRI